MVAVDFLRRNASSPCDAIRCRYFRMYVSGIQAIRSEPIRCGYVVVSIIELHLTFGVMRLQSVLSSLIQRLLRRSIPNGERKNGWARRHRHKTGAPYHYRMIKPAVRPIVSTGWARLGG